MSVPKCKECEDGIGQVCGKWRGEDGRQRYIRNSEARTSPKWCPKRLKESESESD